MRPVVMPFALGLLAGSLGGLMGVGGGILLVPLLVHVLHSDQHEAQGTSLAFVIATAVVAVIPYLLHDPIDAGLAALLAVGAVPGALLGSRIAAATSARRLRVGFGLMMLLTAGRLLAVPPEGDQAAAIWVPGANVGLGLGVGLLSGLLGIGGGTILVPVLVLAERLDQHTAQGVSLLMIIPVGIAGVLAYARQGRLTTRRLPALVLGGALGGLAGALLAHRTEAHTLSRFFAVFLVVAAAQMIFARPRGNVPRSAATPGGNP